MRARLALWMSAGVVGVACNAVLGLEELDRKPSGGSAAEAGLGSDTGGSSGRGGSSGTAGASGTAGESGGGGDGGCEPGHETTCGTAFPTLLGNCRNGQVTCQSNGTWDDCSVTPAASDSCTDVGDDADCDGTTNGGCPCVSGDMRDCGPDTEDGICQLGTQTCENEVWGNCEGAVFPELRDCMSPDDNDCDGSPDNLRDDTCPCAVDGAHVCVEDAPTDWDGPMALASAAATAPSPSCTGTGYEVQVLTKFGAIDMGSAMCGCTCGTPSNQSCGAIQVQAGSTSCVVLQSTIGTPEHTLNPGQCVNVNGSGINFYPDSNYSGGSCTPQPSSNIVRARFTERVTGCETNDASPAGCSAGSQCTPVIDNPLEAYCIYRDGDHPCPSGQYSVRTVFHDTIDDPRSCSSCTCGTSTGSCTGRVAFTRQGSCPGQILVEYVDYGDCANVYDGGLAIQASASTAVPNGMCPPSDVSVQGSVSTAGAVTVCCTP
jgi:hypothetical protein